MNRRNGFTLIELMMSLVILLIITATAIGALVQAQRVTQQIALEANMQEDLRAGMHFIVRDLTQAGEGIPQGGIMIPYKSTGVPANIVRPGTFPSADFASAYVALPAVIPGDGIGQNATGVNPTTQAVITTGAQPTDIITILYADTSLVDSTANHYPLNQFPVNAAPCVAGGGTIAADGTSLTLSTACFTMPTVQPTVVPGDLIMFSCAAGTALELVTSVSSQTINFSSTGDPSGLNGLSSATYPDGTVAKLVLSGDPITITRVWMITYYEDTTTNPTRPQLARQINYPGYPSATPSYPVEGIGEAIEDLQFTYDIINSIAPNGTYPNGAGDATSPAVGYDTALQIRAVNVFLAGRSEYTFSTALSNQYFLHNNLSTQVSIRNLSFVNNFNTSPTATEVTAPGQ
jgi:prepilin-type N-terminal cleavage/methylation domain-containing protein